MWAPGLTFLTRARPKSPPPNITFNSTLGNSPMVRGNTGRVCPNKTGPKSPPEALLLLHHIKLLRYAKECASANPRTHFSAFWIYKIDTILSLMNARATPPSIICRSLPSPRPTKTQFLCRFRPFRKRVSFTFILVTSYQRCQ